MLRTAMTENGMVRGLPGSDVRSTVYRGIPFAADTSGENRWRAPQPVENWEGVRDCYRFAPITMQKTPGLDPDAFYSKEWHCEPEIAMSEDNSLCLNIWTPTKTGDEKFPVMVWIFGGGMQEGYCHEMEFDGESFNRRGVILVSIAYRLNAFGFLCHPELKAENPEAFTNFGLLDQKMALEWVNRNIANFGGDPSNITIFGQSAGAGSTLYHMTSPQSAGLFQKAIVESGGGTKPVYPKVFLPSAMTYEEQEKQGIAFVRDALGCKSIEEARKLDPKFIMQKYAESGYFWQAVIDDKFVLANSFDRILNNEMNDVVFMMGNTTDEFPSVPVKATGAPTLRGGGEPAKTVEDVEQWIRANFGEHADKFIELCHAEAGDDPVAFKKAATVPGFDLCAKIMAEVCAKYDRKFYYYVFGPTIPGDNAGVFHSSDLWFEFETLMKCWRPFDGHHYDLSRKMCNYWANFAKKGDPNGNDADGTPMPNWRPYTKADKARINFFDEVEVTNAPLPEKKQFVLDINLKEYGLK